ncbi:hypothetical protein ACOMHN_040916 [Nucella lapillus]
MGRNSCLLLLCIAAAAVATSAVKSYHRYACMEPNCPPPEKCPAGFKFVTDDYDCKACVCDDCPEPNCTLNCPKGYARVDPSNGGCKTCECTPCPDAPCPESCPTGNETVMDEHGCPDCKCKSQWFDLY